MSYQFDDDVLNNIYYNVKYMSSIYTIMVVDIKLRIERIKSFDCESRMRLFSVCMIGPF